MWVVAKVKIQEISIFKKKLFEKYGTEITFYSPKIEYNKYFGSKVKKFEKLILENYIFCYHKSFNKTQMLNSNKFTKGLQYFLSGHMQNQNEIENFINYCKSFENKNGYLMSLFFKNIIKHKGKFITGPFTNIMFEIVERQKNKLKILIGNIVTTIPDNKKYLYRPV